MVGLAFLICSKTRIVQVIGRRRQLEVKATDLQEFSILVCQDISLGPQHRASLRRSDNVIRQRGLGTEYRQRAPVLRPQPLPNCAGADGEGAAFG